METNKFAGVIAGTPRSGTSIMSKCIHDVVGQSRFFGAGFDDKDYLIDEHLKHVKREDIRAYYREKMLKNYTETPAETKDMNPDGFYECKWTVNGIQETIDDINGKFVKIVNQGIVRSDKNYIDKIIYMARCPRQIAKSQERLGRDVLDTFVNENNESPIIHSPEMFIDLTFDFARWQVINDKPLLLVNYDNLISNPSLELERVRDFLGFESNCFDNHAVKKSLKRSVPEHYEHHLWEMADDMFTYVLNSDWQGVINCYQKHRKEILKTKIAINCARTGEQMSYFECQNCIKNKSTRQSFRNRADVMGIDWINEPCLFKANICERFDETPDSISESIKNNSWNDTVPREFAKTNTQIKSAITTAKGVIRDLINGDKIFVSKDKEIERYDICQSCPFKKENQCTQCGCGIGKMVKFKSKKCPINKWPRLSASTNVTPASPAITKGICRSKINETTK